MKEIRKIVKTVEPEEATDGAGVLLKRVLGTHKLSYIDPFLLLDHFGSEDPDDYIGGFPMHPHRGIETVTYLLRGAVKHRDSEGNEGIIRAGGVQWMTAGSGIIHEEMPQLEDGELEGFQLWVNLPAASKMMNPRYREFGRDEIPVAIPSEGVEVRIIAGRFDETAGAVTELEAAAGFYDVAVESGKQLEFELGKHDNAFVYVFKGTCIEVDGNGEILTAPVLGLFNEGKRISLKAGDAGARLLLVHGSPLQESVARYGPFVMNTREEIAEALNDLSSGTFVK
ncbi:MAG: pirin family protein [Acidobacteriota bacterium]|nr:MAG: pirin family protein [Acidobacteriota bacterium]